MSYKSKYRVTFADNLFVDVIAFDEVDAEHTAALGRKKRGFITKVLSVIKL